MTRKKQKHLLNVYSGERLVGTLTEQPTGALSFVYDDHWLETGYPISQSLPLTTSAYTGSEPRRFFDNLLPDNDEPVFPLYSINLFDHLLPF
jgi:serine/threonine-protein kinase HipA